MKKSMTALLTFLLVGLFAANGDAVGRGYAPRKQCPKGYRVAVYEGIPTCVKIEKKPAPPAKAPEPALPPLTIDRFEPASLHAGDELTIHGSGFTPERIRTVEIGGAYSYVTTVSSTVLKTVTNTSAKTDVVTLNPYKGASVSSARTLEVKMDLVLTKVEPAQAKPGSWIKLYAKGGPQHTWCKIYIGGAHQGTMMNKAGEAMSLMVPKDARNGEILMDCDGQQARSNTLLKLSVVPPKIFAVAPEELMVGEELILHGEDFFGLQDTHLYIAGEEIPIRSIEPKQIKVGSRRAAKNPLIAVVTPSGRGELTPKLRIWSGECANKQINQAFDELLRRKPSGDGNEGQCDPKGYRNGQWASYEDLKFAVRQRFGYVTKPAPKIFGIEPAAALADSWVTILGENFEELQAVVFGSNAASAVERLSSKQLRAKIPSGAGSGEVVVSTLHGVARYKGFAVNYPPRISKIEPSSVEPESWFVIHGENFDSFQTLAVNNQPGGTAEKLSPSQIRAKIPSTYAGKTVTLSVKTKNGDASYSLKVNPEKITNNALGNPEYCFGAVGKGCGGFGDLGEGETKGTRPLWLAAGCSEEANGKRRCWVVPGSIKHDNCCVHHPQGKHCGGPMPDGSKAGEWNHDKNCEKEWDDAFWDVQNGRGWEHDFAAKEPGNLTPASSPMGRYARGEVEGSVNLCAPGGASISARHHLAFCCSGTGQKYWALGVEDWYICQPKSGGRSVQSVAGKKEGTPVGMDMTKAPSKPGQPKKTPIAMAPKPPVPVITALEKTAVEPEEIVTIYGKNFITGQGNKKEINFKELALVQGNKQKIVIANAGKNRGEEQSVFFWVPKDAEGSYTLKIWAKTDEKVTWEKPPLTVAKNAPPLPVMTGVSKNKVEVGESLSLYGKNLIAQDASEFTSMNFKKLYFVEGKSEQEVMAVTSGPRKGQDQSVNFTAPKKTGSYSIKMIAKTGEIITWNNPLVAVVDTAAEEAAKKKAEEELAKKKAPTRLDYEVGLNKLKTEQCSPRHYVTLRNDQGGLANDPKGLRVALDAGGTDILFYADDRCSQKVAQLTYNAAENQKYFHVKKPTAGKVTVTVSAQGIRSGSQQMEIIADPPFISRIEPTSAPPGKTIHIYGKNLEGIEEVVIGKKKIPVTGRPSSTAVQWTVPEEKPGRYQVTVHTPSGQGTWENPFEILESPDVIAKREAEEKAKEELAKKKAAEELAMKQKQEAERQKKLAEEEANRQRELEEAQQRQREEEELARRQQEEQPAQPECRGTWSPTLQRCIEDEPMEEEARPDCPAGTHWSPTLKSCQAD